MVEYFRVRYLESPDIYRVLSTLQRGTVGTGLRELSSKFDTARDNRLYSECLYCLTLRGLGT